MSKALADLLLKDRLITQQQHSEAVTSTPRPGDEVRTLIGKKYVAEPKLLYYLSQRFRLPTVNLAKVEPPQEALRLVPSELARKHGVVPVQAGGGTLVVAIADPTQQEGLEELRFKTRLTIEPVLTSFSALDQALGKHYSGAGTSAILEAAQSFRKKEKADRAATEAFDGGAVDLVQVHDIDAGGASAEDAPVITLVNGLLAEGIRRGASDIHVEPYEKRFRVRMRIDGTLAEIAQIPPEMRRAVVARLKVMSRMDIAESRIPQDGRIKLRAGASDVDFRVNTMPTLFGEKVVLRMLSRGNLQLDLLKLGFEQRQLEVFKKGIRAPNGMVLVTGPTGSGKTTTLYSAITELNQVVDNLCTVEDPVEYNLEGVNQVQVKKEIGLTFAAVLRALLRQDPDTILVGEIRDYETAEVAVQAALTGHLVLSTLHTNDATSTITRLMNMGLEPFLVVASLNVVVAQRLLRTVCSSCRIETRIPAPRLQELGLSEQEVSRFRAFKGSGCPSCNNTGYKGRVAIYEVLDFSPTLKEMVLRGESVAELKKQAIREGMKTLRAAALSKAAEGRTSLEEALSMTLEG
jgi:type IV pilus assembly protein PilB